MLMSNFVGIDLLQGLHFLFVIVILVICKAIQIKDCRAKAFYGLWSKVYRGFEMVSSVTG